MICRSILQCDILQQKIEITHFDHTPNMHADLRNCKTVYEDGWYGIKLILSECGPKQISSIDVSLNGSNIGYVDFEAQSEETVIGEVHFSINNDTSTMKAQPFLLQYDLIVLSITINFRDGTSYEYFSDFLLCISKNPDDVENIKDMLEDLIAFNDAEIGTWLFKSTSNKKVPGGLHEGEWKNQAYKSLGSYIQLIQNIAICYRKNMTYFNSKAKHVIERTSTFERFNNVRKVTNDGFNWLMQNSDQLTEVAQKSGIFYFDKNYLPIKMKTENNLKSLNVYENQVVIGFLFTVLKNAKMIKDYFETDIINEERIIETIHGALPSEYNTPIITIKSLQVSYYRILLNDLSLAIELLQSLYKQYLIMIPLKPRCLILFPRKTKTFQEISPYTQIFTSIIQWFKYGEFNLAKDRLILQVKTLDKLFEYYCLYKLLQLFVDYGFEATSTSSPAFKYEYKVDDGLYQNEYDVANTYRLKKNNTTLTLYFQPVIHSVRLENDIKLYKTTKYGTGYYTPDFVIKFSNTDEQEEYVVLDSKFSSRSNIKKFHLSEVIRKYSTEFAVANSTTAPRMVWVLQGRVKSSENSVWNYHNSPFVFQFKPVTSFGIISINTKVDIKKRFWSELQKNIKCINC